MNSSDILDHCYTFTQINPNIVSVHPGQRSWDKRQVTRSQYTPVYHSRAQPRPPCSNRTSSYPHACRLSSRPSSKSAYTMLVRLGQRTRISSQQGQLQWYLILQLLKRMLVFLNNYRQLPDFFYFSDVLITNDVFTCLSVFTFCHNSLETFITINKKYCFHT